MPICSISRSRSMRKLADMLFEVDEDGCKSDGESDVSTDCSHSDAEAVSLINLPGSSRGAFARCISEDSTLTDTLPFSRADSGATESDSEDYALEEKDEEDTEASLPLPKMPASFFDHSPNEQLGSLIAVARDGTCRIVRPALDEWSTEDNEEPLVAVARDGTCRFARPSDHGEVGDEEEPLIAVRRDGTCELVQPLDGSTHMCFLNYLSFNPFEAEERSSVVMVSPKGSAVYFEDGREVDWARVAAME